AGSAVADSARPHLCDRAAHRGRQAARDRNHTRCAKPDPADGAVAEFHARHLLCADHQSAIRPRRALPYRGADRTRVRGALMIGKLTGTSLRPLLAIGGYGAAVIVLIAL